MPCYRRNGIKPKTDSFRYENARLESKVAGAVILIAGSLWVFLEIVDEIEGGAPDEMDLWAAELLHSGSETHKPIGPKWLITP
jgi:hypothetical protein